ncbi:G-type lectin S-receptor-like serine/threonine-protein kinase LECRK1 [Quercus suber]|uniref:G-type lectin S-receptor-like serine/threonine-protein kinase LECRK1 n=1 Tax=Quercus suber TaxID=58331 RepID=UPI000CE189F9|nr:G-type lectin S-receptor-like serine/threonine-protein kinase LECRK1 [Quercus suber]POE49863.1 g-type lectin s-receptor-like serine/threonine-protein kinase lecrk1 [Quercus suber]
MASIPVLPLLLVFLLPVHANAQRNQSNSNIILLGSSLSPNANRTSWLSPSGLFAFGFYPQDDGFAIGIWLVNQTEKTIIWTANRDDPPVSSNATLNLTIDGKLLLITEQGRELSIIDVDQEDRPATSAAMLDSGNFVLYRNDSYVIWDSFDFPTDTILGGQNLSSGNNLVSSRSISDHSSGHYSFNMQEDGNLVAYPVNSSANTLDAYWYSATDYGNVYASLILSRLGVLFVHLSEFPRFILANSSYPDKNGTTIYRATLDADGIFRLYLHHFKSDNSSSMLMEWSALSDQCDVKGFCGLNSYCSGMGSKADCNCYPGFDFINTSNKFLGCYHNFSEDDCRRSKDPAMLYNATSLANIVLRGNYPYSVEPMKKENCGQFCLEDCNCGAVSYTDSNCRKYKLPLRYGIINANESTPTFFKLKGIHSTQIPELFIGSKSLILILSVILGTVSCLCLVLAASSFFVYRQKLVRYRKLSENVNLGLAEEFTLRLFSYNELESATDGFKEELGRGSYGVVYKGIISSGGKTVAVKRLEKAVEEGEREFQAEMTAIARTHHKNLVRVLGFCIEGSRKLLVYEYMNNGSLADLIFKAERPPIWKERIRIALDVARGLLYLHEEGEVCIIHCNIKPQNILMDDNWTAKISDFGFAKLLIPNQSRATTDTEGRSAYLAPEWEKNSMNISAKADIYSFGVVLLEIVCCRRSIEVNVSTTDEIILTDWVYNCFAAGELEKLVEDENVDFRKLERTVKVGLWCVQEDSALRPSIKNVILMLEGTIDIPVPPSPVLCIAVS